MPRRILISIVGALLVAAFVAPGTTSAATVSTGNAVCQPGFEPPDPDPACWSVIGGEPTMTTEVHHSGSRSAQFYCSATPCVWAYHQDLHIPTQVEEAILRGWFRASETPQGSGDCGIVSLRAEKGDTVQLTKCGSDIGDAWTSGAKFVTEWVQNHAGLDVSLEVLGSAATTAPLYVWVDDVSLVFKRTVTTYARTIDLKLQKHLEASGAVALVSDGPNACLKSVKVKIQRKTDGVWKKIETTTTDATGGYDKGIPDKPGKYRAMSPRFNLTETKVCAKTVSTVETHSH